MPKTARVGVQIGKVTSGVLHLRSYIAWKFIGLGLLKYETIAWLVIGVVHDESILAWRKWNMTKLYDFVGMNFLWPCYFGRHNCLVSMLEVLSFLCQYELLSWIFQIWIFIPQLRRITLKLCQVALRIKNSVFIIYLLEDEQELSLGMLDTSPTYL